MILRPARIDEPAPASMTAEVQRWYVEVYGDEDHDPTPAADFAPPRGRFLVGEVDDEAVAMGGWTRAGDAVQLRRMYVRPAARRAGNAGRLLAALEELAREDGAARVVLATGAVQTAAVAFYRARGYDDVPPFGYHAQEPGVVCLGKDL